MNNDKKNIESNVAFSPEGAVKEARHVTWVGFWINALLGVAKVVGGIFTRSSALVADGVHSFSDFFSDIIVIVMVGIARKAPDKEHQFGHGHYEALATILLSLVLIAVAGGIFYDGLERILSVIHGEELPKPGIAALIILIASIASKEWLYHYTRRVGERIKSEAVIANAWHHRSDSFSSIATLIGVAGAIFLGEPYRILDPIAAAVVAVFIFVVGVKMAKPALGELLGAALPEEDIDAIKKAIEETPGVKAWHHLRTFKSGVDSIVEVHIKVDPDMPIREAHAIATQTEHNIQTAMGGSTAHVNTHIEPYDPAYHCKSGD